MDTTDTGRRTTRAWTPVLVGALLGWTLGLAPALARQAPPADPDALVEEGVRLIEAGSAAGAAEPLGRVFRADPGHLHPVHGAAAFWFAEASLAAGRPDTALAALEAGWDALGRRARIDLRLADALVRHIFDRQDRPRYLAAASAYLTLLRHLDGPDAPELRAIRQYHLTPLALILPEDLKADLGLTDPETAGATPLPTGAGERLLTWWRRMDALPATTVNERLIEHLERVAIAHRTYGDHRAPLGFDDRGRVYIRLGPPGHAVPVTDKGTLVSGLQKVYPDTEFWVYRRIDSAAQYFFVREEGSWFRLGLPSELFRRYRGDLALLHHVYRTLALYSPRQYGAAYEEIARHRDDLAMGTRVVQSTRLPQRAFLQSQTGKEALQDRRRSRARADRVPPSSTNLLDAYDGLPVALRRARFLDPDGTTRTELYWAVPAEALRPSRRVRRRLRRGGFAQFGDRVIDLALVQQTADHYTRRTGRKTLHVPMPAGDVEGGVLPVQTVVVRRDTGTYHLAAQWDVFAAARRRDSLVLGPKIMAEVLRFDTLRALRPAPGRLEMSDLRPLRLPDRSAGIDEAEPFPYAGLVPSVRLGLYFEVYHLTPDASGRARFTVAYRITRREASRGLRRARPARTTTAETRYTAAGPTARERIDLELEPWDAPGDLDILVRVTDEATGRQVERTISFSLIEQPPPDG